MTNRDSSVIFVVVVIVVVVITSSACGDEQITIGNAYTYYLINKAGVEEDLYMY
jgi:hypothetical protein